MSNQMNVFNLPDLGEGLPDAEIIRWLVKVGDTVAVDQPMVEMETAKAVVEVPSPYKGVVTKLGGQSGDVIDVGAVLVEFDGDEATSTVKASSSNSNAIIEKNLVTGKENETIDSAVNSGSSVETLSQSSTSFNVFLLPDLGEGLPDAEIVRWLVSEGDSLALDQPMVEMETAKAVVEVPTPFVGIVAKLHGQAGDVINVGAPLVSFGDSDLTCSEENAKPITDSSSDRSNENQNEKNEVAEATKPADAATVVGAVQVGNKIVSESVSAVIKALARKLKVDLSQVTATGVDGAITQSDVKRAKKEGKLIADGAKVANAPIRSTGQTENPLDFKASPAVRAYALRSGVTLSSCNNTGKKGSITKADVDNANNESRSTATISTSSSKRKPLIFKPSVQPSIEPQIVRGVRRAMAMGMAKSHSVVVPTTLVEDADITCWPKQDSLARYVRALVFAAKMEPALNCWFDGEKFERLIHPDVHVGIAIDSPDGLYVPVIHNADNKNAAEIRERVQELRQKIESKGLKQEDQQGATVTLSNFGSIAGRYGSPVVSPPQVAILGTGRFRNELQLSTTGIENRKMLPLSLTFDHRACTGGEAARFLAAVIEDLEKSH